MKNYKIDQEVIISIFGVKQKGVVTEVKSDKNYTVKSEGTNYPNCGIDGSHLYFNILSEETKGL